MKKLLISLAIIAAAGAIVAQTAKVVCKIKGSDTCLPLVRKKLKYL